MSGLGGWGDPNADFSVPDGGFRNFHISYPSPHIVRRNFTLFSFNLQFPLMTDKQKIGNTSFTASVIHAILETSAGDYKGFQVPLEAPEVRKVDTSNVACVSLLDVTSGPTQWRARDGGRVSCFIVVYASELTSNYSSSFAASSDMVGMCPANAPSNCTQGPTWSPNGVSAYTRRPFPC